MHQREHFKLSDSPLKAIGSDKAISPNAVSGNEVYELARAAGEWQLDAPIVIRSAVDILSTRWRGRFEPFHHQVLNLIRFCRLAPAVLIADDVGLGKTVSAGLILSELMARRRVGRALVICPRVLCEQWVGELANLFDIDAVTAAGRDEFLAAVRGSSTVVITTYETAGRNLNDPAIERDAFQLLIVDEAHRLRNLYGANSSPQFATEIQNAVEQLQDDERNRRFPYVLMLTATPVQNRLADLYSLIDVLAVARGHTNPLGRWEGFLSRYVQPGSGGRRLRPELAEEFRTHLGRYVIRTRRLDANLPFPERRVVQELVRLTASEQQLVANAGGILSRLNSLSQSSLAEALMSSPAALAAQLQGMLPSYPFLRTLTTAAQNIASGATLPAKLTRLVTLCEQLRAAAPDRWRVVVFTRRRETQLMIVRELTRRGMAIGLISGGRRENAADVQRFVSDEPQVNVLVSTDAGAEGINLQQANVLVNYDLPWNPMVLEQRIGRVQRLRSPHQFVVVYNLIAEGTVEQLVVARLLERLRLVADTVGGVESLLAETNDGAHEWAEQSFEAAVRDMVLLALKGVNVEAAAAQVDENILAARREYEEHHGRMNSDLGALDGENAFGPLPVFERPSPSIPADQFVLRALEAEGGRLQQIAPNLFFDKRPSTKSLIALTPEAGAATIGDVPAEIYAPGYPAFDALTARWVRRQGHLFFDRTSETLPATERLVRQWCAGYPSIRFQDCVIRVRRPLVQGQVLVRAEAENRIDQHQRLLELRVVPEGHSKFPPMPQARPVTDPFQLTQASPHVAARVEALVLRDTELVQFAAYYRRRLTAELDRAGANPNLRKRIEDDFTVRTSAEIVAFRGDRYDEVIVDVTFLVDEEEYSATLLIVPASGQVIEKPAEDHCPITGVRMPYGVLARSDRTGRLVPQHQLLRSVFTSRLAEREYMVRCELTQKLAIDDELVRSAISGVRAYRDHFVTCARSGVKLLTTESGTSSYSGVVVPVNLLRASMKSGRLGVLDELVRCEVTKQLLLPDERGQSDVSQRWVDSDLLHPSQKTGRMGLEEEMVVCESSGIRLLRDEAETCSLTGLRVDIELLSQCAVSGLSARRDLLATCAESGSLALPSELQTCTESGAAVLPGLLGTCAFSGRRVLNRLLLTCQVTGDPIAQTHAVRSDLSGRVCRVDRIRRSERPPHRTGLPDEFAVCAITHRALLKDELGQSMVSGRLIDHELLVEARGQLAHPDELERCCLSNQLTLPSELETCSETGRRAIRTAMVRCADSHVWLLPDAAGRSNFNPRWVRRSLLIHSAKPPGRPGTREEFGVCVVSRRLLLLDELTTTADSRLVDRDLVSKCAVTGRTIIKEEAEICDVTRQVAEKGQLRACAVTGRRVLPSQLVRCSETGKEALPAKIGYSDYRDRPVLRSLLSPSSKSPGRLGTRDEFVTCSVTHRGLLKDEVAYCQRTRQLVDRELLVSCDGVQVLKSETAVCQWSGQRYLRDTLWRCELTHLQVSRQFLDKNYMLRPLAELLDRGRGERRRDLIAPLQEIAPASFRDVRSVLAVTSPSGNRAAIRVEVTERSWLGLRRRVLLRGCVAIIEPEIRILGNLVTGTNEDDVWYQSEDPISFK